MEQETQEAINEKLESLDIARLDGGQLKKLESLKQKLVYLPIDEVVPSKNKARKNMHAVPTVAASIRQLGFRNPIYIDAKTNTICSGHTRWYAAKKLGLTKVPCVPIDDLSPELLRLLRLADNKVAEIAGWDFSELESELSALKIDLPDIDLGELGFSSGNDVDVDNFFEDGAVEGKPKEAKKVKCTCPECGHEFEQEI